jgi:hypothetical protein
MKYLKYFESNTNLYRALLNDEVGDYILTHNQVAMDDSLLNRISSFISSDVFSLKLTRTKLIINNKSLYPDWILYTFEDDYFLLVMKPNKSGIYYLVDGIDGLKDFLIKIQLDGIISL